MAKTITIKFEDREYTLEFTRESIRTMERRGFRTNDISEKPMSTLPTLFAGAFLAHHRTLKQSVIDAIFDKLPRKDEFITKLAELYNEPLEAMLDEPDDSAGNADWGASW